TDQVVKVDRTTVVCNHQGPQLQDHGSRPDLKQGQPAHRMPALRVQDGGLGTGQHTGTPAQRSTGQHSEARSGVGYLTGGQWPGYNPPFVAGLGPSFVNRQQGEWQWQT